MAYGFLIQLGVALLLTVAAELLRPKPKLENARAKGLGDFDFPTATEGRVVPIAFGRVMMQAPNVVWYGDFRTEKITKFIKTGLLGGGSRITQGFRYIVGVQGALCRGPIDEVHGIWLGDNREYHNTGSTVWTNSKFEATIDDPELFGGNADGTGGFQATFEFMRGDATQPVNSYLARHQTIGASAATPRYNDTCYFVARHSTGQDKGAYVGNSASLKPWKFEISRYPAVMPGQATEIAKIGEDCNPVNVLFELLTNSDWGLGFAQADIDLPSFIDVSNTCWTEGLGFSMVIDGAMTASDFMQEIERHIDGVVYLDKTSGLWSCKLARGGYVIGDLPSLTEDNVLEVVKFDQGSWNETVNRVDAKFNHRANDYKESYATSSDSANYLTQGGGTLTSGTHNVSEVSFPGVKDPAVAAQLAWRELRALSYPLAKAQFKVTREFWDLNLGDVIRWTDDRFGYSDFPMRVTKIDFGKLDRNEIVVDVVQDVFQFQDASYAAPPTTSWVGTSTQPLAYLPQEQYFEEAPLKIALQGGNATYPRIIYGASFSGPESRYKVTYTPQGPQYFAGGTALPVPLSFPEQEEEHTNYLALGRLAADIDLLSDPGAALNTSGAVDIVVSPEPSSAVDIVETFNEGGATDAEMGESLIHLFQIGEEMMFAQSASVNGDGNVVLSGVRRGVLDTVQKYHSTGDYITFFGNGLNLLPSFPEAEAVSTRAAIYGDMYDYQNVGQSNFLFTQVNYRGEEFTGAKTAESVTPTNRSRRPAPATGVLYSGVAYQRLPNVDAGGSIDVTGQTINFRARDLNNLDEIAALTTDDTDVDASTEYRVRTFVDPDGANNLAYDSGWNPQGTTCPLFRLDLINQGSLTGMECEVQVDTRHTSAAYTAFMGDSVPAISQLEARDAVRHRIFPQSALSFFTYMGGNLGAGVASSTKIAQTTDNYLILVGQAGGTVLASVNGGTFTTVIASGTFGVLPLTAGDSVQLQRVGSALNTTFTIIAGTDGGYGSFT